MKIWLATIAVASLISMQVTSEKTIQEFTTQKRVIKSVDVMKESRDRLCNPRAKDEVEAIISRIAEVGATHVALPLFVNTPSCTTAMYHFDLWVNEIRAQNLSVWYRLSTLEWEGFYDTQKKVDPEWHSQSIAEFARIHPRLFRKGDLITPQPEPQNAGITGVNCFDGNCMFKSSGEFNDWLVKNKKTVEDSLSESGVAGVEVGFYGFDGYIAWGDDNPDWSGIINPETAQAIGPITIDHYFSVADDPSVEFQKVINKFPNSEICVGEWGAINGESSEQTRKVLQAALDQGITCFNYWHSGPSGTSEAILNDDFSPKPIYYDLQWFFRQF